METRVELKFMLNIEDYRSLRRQLALIMESDKFATYDKGYFISSLYFDDMYDSGAYDKADGVEFHKKYRIRTYENGTKRLEYKIKNGNTTNKELLVITNELEKALIARDFNVLSQNMDEGLIKNIVLKMKLDDLKPRLYVDYFREAYIFNNGNIRITFDKDIMTYNWYNKNMKYKVLEPRQVILEVKYRKHLPDFIRKVVFSKNYQAIPYSKYLMGWLKINNWGV
ncbi:polyphosphate polymerase domain-containing protein [Mycoplasmatota bacterium WC30]